MLKLPGLFHKKKGFTLVELMLVIALIGILTVPSYFAFITVIQNQKLTKSVEVMAENFRQAHVFAREAKDYRHWGIELINDNSYQLVSSADKLSVTPVKIYKLEQDVKINPFTPEIIWFNRGLGATSAETIKLENKNKLTKEIEILTSGVVSVK